jgi:hypothetical protein
LYEMKKYEDKRNSFFIEIEEEERWKKYWDF